MSVEVAVVVGDLHAGSTVALCPPKVINEDGFSYTHNEAQKWLWKCWRRFTDRWLPKVLNGRPYILVHNGDAVQGTWARFGQLVSSEFTVQAQIATDLLLPLAQPAESVYMVKGTEVHVGRMVEHSIGMAIGAKPHPKDHTRAPHHWNIKINGTLCSFRHHMSTTSRKWLEASALSIMAINEREDAAQNGHPQPSLVCRAHRHVYGLWMGNGIGTVVGPSWQLSTTHAHKVATGVVAPVGAYVLDWGGVEKGGLPAVRPFLCRLPVPAVEEIA